MKLDQRTLEIMCLSAITKSTRCMDKALLRNLSLDHFVFQEQNEKLSYTKSLFALIQQYWEESKGSLVTSFVLESKLNEHKVKEIDRRKLVSLWDEIENSDCDENDFFEVISQLKKFAGLRNLTIAFEETNEYLSEGNLKKTIETIQDKIDINDMITV